MKVHFICLLLVYILISSCQNSSKDKADIINEQIVKNHKKDSTSKKTDNISHQQTLTQETAIAFLTEFGKQNPEREITIETEFGTIEIELFEDCPLHRANFIFLVKNHYFDDTFFHRVVYDFIIQGGNSDDMKTIKKRKKIGDYLIPKEFSSSHKHHYGALAAARSWDNNPEKLSNPFEFYIVQNKNGAHHLDGEHTVFGKVTSGFEIVDKIAQQETDQGDYPLMNILIKMHIR